MTSEVSTEISFSEPLCDICEMQCDESMAINDGLIAHVCTQCDLAMTNAQNIAINRVEINEQYYDLEQRVRTYYARSKEFEYKYGQLLSLLRRVSNNEVGTLLEVGSNIGFFSHFMNCQGIHVTSVEINCQMREFQRLVYGISPLEQISQVEPSLKFDAIVLMDVLEHIQKPVEVLSDLACRLTSGGAIFLQFPNKNSLSARLAGPAWGWWQAPDHIYHFSPYAVIKLAAKAGLKVSFMQTVSPLVDELTNLPRIGKMFAPLMRFNRSFVLNRFIKWKRGSLIQAVLIKG